MNFVAFIQIIKIQCEPFYLCSKKRKGESKFYEKNRGSECDKKSEN